MDNDDLTAGQGLRTRVKICGITRLEDALFAASLGVDALGFVFYEKSPRYIKPVDAQRIIKSLPPFVTIVGLFVNPSQHDIDAALSICALDVIQLHGEESPDFCHRQSRRVIKALPVAEPADLAKLSEYSCAVLLDAKAPDGVFGGTGVSFDWSLIQDLKHDHDLILAGGLNTSNIAQALTLKAWPAVDVSSGVEQNYGIKSKDKMKGFCKIVQQFSCRV